MPKKRLDVLVTDSGIAESREKARRMILAGNILVNGSVEYKASRLMSDDAKISASVKPRFVGRGGEKLEAAFKAFNLDVLEKVCMDVGASTGGFTDCLLQHGAAKVIAIDVGKGQLHWNLRNDPRVIVMEEINARYLKPTDLPDTPTLSTIDVSFISLTKILPAVVDVMLKGGLIITLVKPQFEAGREKVERGGVVRDEGVHREVLNKIRAFGEEKLRLQYLGEKESPIKGPAGNKEFLLVWRHEVKK